MHGRLILVRAYDKSLWRRTYEIEWVASHEGERGVLGRRLKDVDVIGIDDLDPIDLVVENPGCRLQLNLVVLANIFEFTKEGVAVAGDSAVPAGPWKRRAFDMSGTQPQRSRTGPLQDCDGNS
jgi:hypothetical protein